MKETNVNLVLIVKQGHVWLWCVRGVSQCLSWQMACLDPYPLDK